MTFIRNNRSDRKKHFGNIKRGNQKRSFKATRHKDISFSGGEDLGSLLHSQKINILTHKYSKKPTKFPSLEPCQSSKNIIIKDEQGFIIDKNIPKRTQRDPIDQNLLIRKINVMLKFAQHRRGHIILFLLAVNFILDKSVESRY